MSKRILNNWKRSSLSVVVVLGLLGLGLNSANAQQDPYFTHYMFNKLQFNPGAAGAKDGVCIAGIFHTQWTGYEDQTFEYNSQDPNNPGSIPTGLGPKTTGIAIDGKVASLSRKIDLGMGLALAQDNLGYENNLKFRGAFSGIYNMTNGSSLALGIELGMLQKGIDGTNFIFRQANDPNIPNTNVTKSNFNLAAGLYYVNPNVNDLYIGLSSTNINEKDFDYANNNGTFSNRSKRHFYLLAGMTMPNFLGNPSLELMPSLLLKNANTTQVTLSGLVEYSNTFSGGLGYRSELDAISVLLGYKVTPELRIGYSYDVSLNALRKFQGGSHEFQINYCFTVPAKPADKPNIELTPRFLNKDPDIF